MIRKLVLAVSATAMLAACSGGETYALPESKVRSKLMALRPPMFVFGGSGVSAMVTQPANDQIRWTMVNDGKPLMSFVATIAAKDDASTNVAITAEPAPGKENTVIGRRMNANPAIIKLYQAAMVEQVDSKLEGRDFNMSAIQGQMMAAALSTLPQMQSEVAKAAHDSDVMEREARADADDAAFEREQREKIEGKSSGY